MLCLQVFFKIISIKQVQAIFVVTIAKFPATSLPPYTPSRGNIKKLFVARPTYPIVSTWGTLSLTTTLMPALPLPLLQTTTTTVPHLALIDQKTTIGKTHLSILPNPPERQAPTTNTPNRTITTKTLTADSSISWQRNICGLLLCIFHITMNSMKLTNKTITLL